MAIWLEGWTALTQHLRLSYSYLFFKSLSYKHLHLLCFDSGDELNRYILIKLDKNSAKA